MYKALKRFKDLQDNGHVYEAGDVFPREGVVASTDRIEELATDKNKRGIPLIEEIPEKVESEDIPKEVVSEPKEDTGDAQTDVSPSKKTKTKKNAKKAQE